MTEIKPEQKKEFKLPMPLFYIARFVRATSSFWMGVGNLESARLRKRMGEVTVDRPIYVCSLARSGTTITLEIINKHPDTVAHRYSDLPQMYTPYIWNWLMKTLPIPKEEPVERIHKDGLFVTPDSPEAMEEMLWMKFFDGTHDENRPNIFHAGKSNPRFEAFYKDHIKKLLLVRGGKRYLAKGNYNISRMGYILSIFPDAKFIVPVRHPINHIASLLKQDRLFKKMQDADWTLIPLMETMGHFEFGHGRHCINFNNGELIEEINQLLKEGHAVRAFGLYWNAIFSFVLDQLEATPDLKKACIINRYEDLCDDTGLVIDRIINHCQLPGEPFQQAREEFIKMIKKPTYYSPNFTDEELKALAETTGETAARLGYQFPI